MFRIKKSKSNMKIFGSQNFFAFVEASGPFPPELEAKALAACPGALVSSMPGLVQNGATNAETPGVLLAGNDSQASRGKTVALQKRGVRHGTERYIYPISA